MGDQILSTSDTVAPTPSGATVPVYTVSRLQNIVTAHLAAVRRQRCTLDEAEQNIRAALDRFEQQQRAAAAARDAEVTRPAEGKVTADPSTTSARAARLVAPRTGSQRADILRFVVEGNGSTDFEIARDLRILPNSVRPRRGELAEGGYVIDSGRTRQHRGSDWVVWEATGEGRAWHRRAFGGAA